MSIGAFFCAVKSLLDLGDEFKGHRYDLADKRTALVVTGYIILQRMRRKNNNPNIICGLFRVCCDGVQDIELSTA